MQEPAEVEDRQDEQAVARVAAVDVAKASGVVCTRVPRAGEPGRFITKVWPVGATTNAILELAGHLTALERGSVRNVSRQRLVLASACRHSSSQPTTASPVPNRTSH
jgi:hypothetical protein